MHACPPLAELSGGAVAHYLHAAAGPATPAAAASLQGGSPEVTCTGTVAKGPYSPSSMSENHTRKRLSAKGSEATPGGALWGKQVVRSSGWGQLGSHLLLRATEGHLGWAREDLRVMTHYRVVSLEKVPMWCGCVTEGVSPSTGCGTKGAFSRDGCGTEGVSPGGRRWGCWSIEHFALPADTEGPSPH